MITLLGTSHVSKQSSHEVEQAIVHADLVAIELDAGRVQGMLQSKEATFREMRAVLGTKTALIASIMRSLQKRIAKHLGVLPGVEMRTALLETRKANKPLALIDRDITVTMKRLGAVFGWPEVKRLGKDMFRRRKISIHPSDDMVLELLGELREHYPRLYQVLVHERDVHMAHAVVYLGREHPEKNILVIVGKGHIPGMLQQIKHLNPALQVSLWSSTQTSEKQSLP